jgi:hypothetical protein
MGSSLTRLPFDNMEDAASLLVEEPLLQWLFELFSFRFNLHRRHLDVPLTTVRYRR